MGLRSLISFLTIIPAGRGSLEEASRSLYLSPVVGLIEGAAAVLLAYALEDLPRHVAAAMLLAYHAVVTGGLHLDGFSDYVEVLASRARGEDAERIIKDPRRGSFSITYTTILLILRYTLLLEVLARPTILLPSYIAAAQSLYVYIAASRGRGRGLAAMFKAGSSSMRERIYNTIIYLALQASTLQLPGAGYGRVAVIAATPLLAVPVAIDSWRRMGRPSGDAAGFSYEVVLTSALLVGLP